MNLRLGPLFLHLARWRDPIFRTEICARVYTVDGEPRAGVNLASYVAIVGIGDSDCHATSGDHDAEIRVSWGSHGSEGPTLNWRLWQETHRIRRTWRDGSINLYDALWGPSDAHERVVACPALNIVLPERVWRPAAAITLHALVRPRGGPPPVRFFRVETKLHEVWLGDDNLPSSVSIPMGFDEAWLTDMGPAIARASELVQAYVLEERRRYAKTVLPPAGWRPLTSDDQK